jgi:hypothetical protein
MVRLSYSSPSTRCDLRSPRKAAWNALYQGEGFPRFSILSAKTIDLEREPERC